MWDTPSGSEFVEDGTSLNPDKFLSIFGVFTDGIDRGPIASQVVIPFLYGHGFIEFVVVGGDTDWTLGHWNRDLTLFTRDDEVAEISSVCAVEMIFQSLI